MSHLVHFPAGGSRFAIPLDRVGEIAEVGRIDSVPRAPSIVAGVAEVRGRIVTLLTLDADPEPLGAAAPPHLAILLAPPHDRIGIVVRALAHEIVASSEAPQRETPSDRGPGSAGSDGPAGAFSGPEVPLRGGGWARMILVDALVEHCRARARAIAEP